MCALFHSARLSDTALGSDDSQEVPPVPIPNTEVKLHGADGTAGVALWESRLSLPIPFKTPLGISQGRFSLDLHSPNGRGGAYSRFFNWSATQAIRSLMIFSAPCATGL